MKIKNIIALLAIIGFSISLDWEWSNIKSFISGAIVSMYVVMNYMNARVR